MKKLICILTILSAGTAVHAGLFATPITNGDFEDDLGSTVGSGVSNFASTFSGWFTENDTTIAGDFIQWEGANTNIPVDVDGEVWAGVNTDSGSSNPGAFYQQIGTFEDNMNITVNFTAGDRSNKLFPDLVVSIYSGNGTGADETILSSFATSVDSSTVTSASLWANDNLDGSVGTQTAPVSINFNTGTSGTAGDALWLEFSYDGPDDNGDYHALIDDVSVIPEPSSLILIGLAGLAVLGLRRRVR